MSLLEAGPDLEIFMATAVQQWGAIRPYIYNVSPEAPPVQSVISPAHRTCRSTLLSTI